MCVCVCVFVCVFVFVCVERGVSFFLFFLLLMYEVAIMLCEGLGSEVSVLLLNIRLLV